MNWIKVKDIRINLDNVKMYKKYLPYDINKYNNPYWNGNKFPVLIVDSIEIVFDNEEELDESIKQIDEVLEKGLHTLKEFKLP